MYTKDDLLARIKELHDEIYSNQKIRPRAQERVCAILNDASDLLNPTNPSMVDLNNAACMINLARITLNQVNAQSIFWTIIISLWSVAFLVASAALILTRDLYPQLTNETPGVVLLGAVAWGVGGSALHGLVELHRRYARQEFDSRRSLWYLSHPVIGGGLGAIVFLLVLVGLLSVGQTAAVTGSTGFNGSTVLLMAAVVGFEQPHVVNFLGETARKLFRVSETSINEGG